MMVRTTLTPTRLLLVWTVVTIQVTSVVAVGSATYNDNDASCRSNATHIAWRGLTPQRDTAATTAVPRRELQRETAVACTWKTHAAAQLAAYSFLREHVMDFDLPFLGTLGFDDTADLPDGLNGGLIGPTITLALQAKIDYATTDSLPMDIWQEYVLNYSNLNEARTNWRPLLNNKLRVLVENDDTKNDDSSSAMTTAETVQRLNAGMWKLLAPASTDCITFVSSETPLIFDPMSVLVWGHASCSGLAVLFVNALRAFGVAARVAGTPAWYQDRASGNHNWVEVYDDAIGQWKFLEPSPNQTVVDTLDRDPCERWFCSSSRFHFDNTSNTTLVSAARLNSVATTFFRLAWEWNTADVPGEDVSSYYQRTCSQCR